MTQADGNDDQHNPDDRPQRPIRRDLRTVGRWSAFGIQLVVSVVIGLLAGQWLDGRLGTEPWLAVVGILMGFTAAMVDLVRLARKGGL